MIKGTQIKIINIKLTDPFLKNRYCINKIIATNK